MMIDYHHHHVSSSLPELLRQASKMVRNHTNDGTFFCVFKELFFFFFFLFFFAETVRSVNSEICRGMCLNPSKTQSMVVSRSRLYLLLTLILLLAILF